MVGAEQGSRDERSWQTQLVDSAKTWVGRVWLLGADEGRGQGVVGG